mmetsp:Transcript_9049/g.17697  ORF Transcript_9049/g.17697 Transcript_9049/m.17697 type:complete len:85 (-) Transcript_9049:285-539(-)|eukprot:CAMPEP_0167786160 /NCGR_PEP_ID=MMETSP0111_2-20121227/8625_1 /TAXON_ID=91324 /ORGANISM="Lotharella globosa, Strain CCCM811" /LENGTH=84 /DNA_ID=CAMNT_0007677485 /DNA_START=39 /DNA_END=293 /DNA_ORIENTATION=+
MVRSGREAGRHPCTKIQDVFWGVLEGGQMFLELLINPDVIQTYQQNRSRGGGGRVGRSGSISRLRQQRPMNAAPPGGFAAGGGG